MEYRFGQRGIDAAGYVVHVPHYVAQVDFVLREHVPNEFVRVNPLGLQVEYFRVDQAFEDRRR